METDELIIHTDGGSRGNPGPGACAFTVEYKGKIVYKKSAYIGKCTNNFAEYSAVIMAVRWLSVNSKKYIFNSALFLLDSELVVRQINGIYKVKDKTIKNFTDTIFKIIKENDFEIIFKHIPRVKNKLADILVNKELDKRPF